MDAILNKRFKGSAMARHMQAIESGNVTKTNVIGMRKAINHVNRIARGWSGNRSNATQSEVTSALTLLQERKPLVRGELHASGVRLLADRRYRKRLEPVKEIVDRLHGFRLVDFEERGNNAYPVYEAVSDIGSFRFINIPWQAHYSGIETGLEILP